MPHDDRDERYEFVIGRRKPDPDIILVSARDLIKFLEKVSEDHRSVLRSIDEKLRQLHETVETIMATAADLNAKVDGLNTAFANIRKDIQAIKDSLPASGGMTQAEVDALDTRLGETLATGQALDAENPGSDAQPST